MSEEGGESLYSGFPPSTDAALRRAFGFQTRTPSMFSRYLRETYPDVWEYLNSPRARVVFIPKEEN